LREGSGAFSIGTVRESAELAKCEKTRVDRYDLTAVLIKRTTMRPVVIAGDGIEKTA
jgi:hypothetical protein